MAEGRFNGGAITRVQDNYVVQWAARPLADKPAKPPKPLPAEYERPAKGLSITPLGSTDTYAPSGFANGWPVAQDSKTGTAYFSGKFKDENIKREFLNYINSK